MTPTEYYEGDIYLPIQYAKAHRLELEEKNLMLWLGGAYNNNATMVALANAFGKKKVDYLEKPFDVISKTPEQLEIEKEKAIGKTVDFLNSLKTQYDRKNKK